MDTPILCSPANATIVNNATRYSGIFGNGQVSSGANPRVPVAEAGTFSGLVVRLGTAMSGGTSLVVTFQLGTGGATPSDTAMTVTFLPGDQVKAYAGSAISAAAGDEVMIKWVPTGTPTLPADIQCALIFTGTAAGTSILSSGHGSTANANFLIVGNGGANATETTQTLIAPCAGVIDKMYVRRNTATGAGATASYTLRQGVGGAAMADTALAVTIDNSALVGNTTSSISVAAGDFLSIGLTVSAGPAPAAAVGNVGLRWTPTIEGEALLFASASTGASSAADRFIMVNGTITASGTTESDAYNIAPMAFTARKLYGRVTTAPASGKSWTDTLMVAGAAQTLTASVADANTTFTPDTTNSVSVANQNLIDLRITPAGTPTAYGAMGMGMVAFTGVEGGGGGRMLLMGVG